MAAVTTAVVAGAGLLLTVYGQQQAAQAEQKAADLNAKDAAKNARLSMEKAQEDGRVFMMSFRRDQARNEAQIGASGIKQEGSPLEALQDNARMAAEDYQNIIRGGQQQRDSYLRQAKIFRAGGQASANAGNIGSAATLLRGSADIYSTGSKAGAF